VAGFIAGRDGRLHRRPGVRQRGPAMRSARACRTTEVTSMGVNFDYPNPDAIKVIGVYGQYDKSNGHPDGWTEAVVNKIQQEVANHNNTRAGSLGLQPDLSHYTAEEKAAYQWYKDNVLDDSHWKTLVKNYESNPANTANIKPDTYNPDDQYIPNKDSGFQPPDVKEFNGGNNKGGQLAVSYDAVNYFIKELEAVAPDGHGILLTAREELNHVDLKPGGFARAELMRQKVMGASGDDPGLRGDTMALLVTLHSALFDIRQDLHNLLTEYQNTEDFNKLTADQFNSKMDDAWSKISTVDQYGKTSSTGGGTGGGSGSGSGSGDGKK
jgi:hypothetical protein